MIHFSVNLRNPFIRLHLPKVIYTTSLFDHKCLEIEYVRDSDVIGLWLNWTIRQSHAGISFGLNLLSYGLSVTLADTRHWDYDNNCWEENEE